MAPAPALMEKSPTAAHAPAAGRRILIVDDNVDAAMSLAQLLELDGHQSEAVYGALEALERIPQFRPDIVLLDIGLPEMTGYEVAKRLRQMSELGPMKLIALTGYGHSEHKARAFAAGFDAHLAKPVDLVALERMLAR